MKVLVHLNHTINKSFMLAFGQGTTPGKVRAILENASQEAAIQTLLLRAASRVEIPAPQKRRAQAAADFTITESYTLERLA